MSYLPVQGEKGLAGAAVLSGYFSEKDGCKYLIFT